MFGRNALMTYGDTTHLCRAKNILILFLGIH